MDDEGTRHRTREAPLQSAQPEAKHDPRHSEISEIFDLHHDRVFRVAYRITGSASDAEDALQTIFLRLLRREEPIPSADEAGSYLHRAAVHASLDLLRRRRSARSVPLDLAAGHSDPLGGPDADREASELRERLRRAVAELPPRASLMFTLRYFEGLDNREIARRLGTSWSVVAVTLHRTRARLRKELLGGSR